MATAPKSIAKTKIDYPTTDGKPLGETEVHRDDMMDLIETLKHRFADVDDFYVSGNLLLYYIEGDKHRHVSPDVFVVRGVPKTPKRDYYLLWEEGHEPDLAIELTSKSTRHEDQRQKFLLYRDVLHVREYFLFDPRQDYLKPSMQGYRLIDEEYYPIAPIDGRLPSEVLGVHLERIGEELRLFDPETGRLLPTPRERIEQAEAKIEQVETENERLRRELEILKKRIAGTN